MPAVIAAANTPAAMVAGMSWSTLNATGRGRNVEIRTLARDAEADRILVLQSAASPSRAAVGTFSTDELELDLPGRNKRKKLHSLAAAFAKMAPDGFALLAYALPPTAHSGSDEHVAIVVCEAGLPQADDVKTALDALAVVANYATGQTGFTYTVYSNDSDLFPQAVPISDGQLWAGIDRSTQLHAVPLDIAKVGGAALVAVLLLASVLAWQSHSERQRLQELQRRALLDDPLPRYRQALTPALAALGMPPAQARRLLALMSQYPVFVEGWALREVDCSIVLQGCSSTWERVGGTTEALLNARKALGDRLASAATSQVGTAGGDAANSANLRTIRLIRAVPIDTAGVSAREELAPGDAAKLATISFAQQLDNAGVQFRSDAAGYVLWPRVPGLPARSLPSGNAVQALPVEMGMDGALANSIIDRLPRWIWIQGLKADVDGASMPPRVQLVLRGMSYVR
jgi:hypothetical protein